MRRSKKVFAELLAAPLMFPCEGGREKVPRKYCPVLGPFLSSDLLIRSCERICSQEELDAVPRGMLGTMTAHHQNNRKTKSARPGSRLRSRRAPGPKPVLHRRILRALGQGPCYTKELASRVHASDFWTREVLKQLETRGLVRSWTFAQADRGGRNLTVHAWRLTTGEERRHGKEDPNATAHASALLSKMLRGQLSRVERMNELLAAEAERDREARLSSS
jgi:hypothetical protein